MDRWVPVSRSEFPTSCTPRQVPVSASKLTARISDILRQRGLGFGEKLLTTLSLVS